MCNMMILPSFFRQKSDHMDKFEAWFTVIRFRVPVQRFLLRFLDFHNEITVSLAESIDFWFDLGTIDDERFSKMCQ